jgi:hypothetical protein
MIVDVGAEVVVIVAIVGNGSVVDHDVVLVVVTTASAEDPEVLHLLAGGR